MILLWCTGIFAAIVPERTGRFDALVIPDPSTRVGIVAETPSAIPGFETARDGWGAFRQAQGGDWQVWVDRRSGAPTWAQGSAIAWLSGDAEATTGTLESHARAFVATHGALLRLRDTELVLNRAGSGRIGSSRWVLVFDRSVGGIPVEGESVTFFGSRGSLVAFGASRWGAIEQVAPAAYDADTAWAILRAYMGVTADDRLERVESGSLVLVATPPAGDGASRYAGPVGGGVEHALAWRFSVRVEGEPGTWVGKIDARAGTILAFYDDDMYAGVKGGVYPISNDQNCADYGCEVAGFPMPYAAVTVAKKSVATGDMGRFACPPKGNKSSSVSLTGPYVTTQDTCGRATASGNCTSDLDFGSGPGTDCTAPAGGSVGDTHAGRVT
jgi:hypothetical protein